jgi:hypothetical protein
LAFATFLLNFGGSCARIFTTLKEVNEISGKLEFRAISFDRISFLSAHQLLVVSVIEWYDFSPNITLGFKTSTEEC